MKPSSLKYSYTEDKTLLFEAQVLAHFEHHKQHGALSKEAGGQLFADLSDPAIIPIVAATGPRKTDKRSFFGYRPDRNAERREIVDHYKQGLHFVGDWHTHRERKPTPSPTDVESMQDMVRQSLHDLAGYVMVIVGQAEFPAGLHVSLHCKDDWAVLTRVEPPHHGAAISSADFEG